MLANHCTRIARPITAKMVRSNAVPTLKWLVVPRAACKEIVPTSMMNTIAVAQPAIRRTRGHSGR